MRRLFRPAYIAHKKVASIFLHRPTTFNALSNGVYSQHKSITSRPTDYRLGRATPRITNGEYVKSFLSDFRNVWVRISVEVCGKKRVMTANRNDGGGRLRWDILLR